MSLPESLKLAIEEETRLIGTNALLNAAQELSQRYRDRNSSARNPAK